MHQREQQDSLQLQWSGHHWSTQSQSAVKTAECDVEDFGACDTHNGGETSGTDSQGTGIEMGRPEDLHHSTCERRSPAGGKPAEEPKAAKAAGEAAAEPQESGTERVLWKCRRTSGGHRASRRWRAQDEPARERARSQRPNTPARA